MVASVIVPQALEGLPTGTRHWPFYDAMRSVIDATGVLKGKTCRALDSTLLDVPVATQNTVTQQIAAIRRCAGSSLQPTRCRCLRMTTSPKASP